MERTVQMLEGDCRETLGIVARHQAHRGEHRGAFQALCPAGLVGLADVRLEATRTTHHGVRSQGGSLAAA